MTVQSGLAVRGTVIRDMPGGLTLLPCPECVRGQIDNRRSIDVPHLIGCRKCLDVTMVRPSEGGSEIEWAQGVPRIEELAPLGSVMSGVLSSIDDVIDNMPTLPEVPQRVVSMVHDPLISIAEIADVINEDSVMSVKVLGMANSAYYSPVSEVADLRTACSLLGLRALASVAHAVAARNMYRVQNPAFRGLMEQLWRHGVASAHIADELGDIVGASNTNILFLAGLTHDVGKLVLLDSITNRYKGATGRLKESPDLIVKVMNRFAPLVGFHVVEHWRLPPELGFTTLYQPCPENVPVHDAAKLVRIVSLASDIADYYGYNVGEQQDPVPISEAHIEALDLSQEKFDEYMTIVSESLDSILGIFGSL